MSREKISTRPNNLVEISGTRDDPQAYEIRDFLKRSGVEFRWQETPDGDSHDLVVKMADGQNLSKPTVRDVAEKLGFVVKPTRKEYDVSIYGAGPAGLSAAVYAASEGLSTVLIERSAVGGQAGTTSMIENYLGFPDGIAGADLAERARQQALKFGVEILMMREGIKAEFHGGRIWADLADGNSMVARANICATGVDWRRLGLELEENLLGRGIYYGAGASEAPLCKDEHVFVVGGGNSAGQAVMHLAGHAKKVTMLVRNDALAASMSSYLSKRIEQAKNVEVLFNSEISALDGGESLGRVQVRNKDGKEAWTDTNRLFVTIGGVPHTEWAKDTPIIRDRGGYLVTGPDLMEMGKAPESWPLDRAPHFLETSVPGSFAAGDVRARSIKRVATASGEGAMAVSFVHHYLAETA